MFERLVLSDDSCAGDEIKSALAGGFGFIRLRGGVFRIDLNRVCWWPLRFRRLWLRVYFIGVSKSLFRLRRLLIAFRLFYFGRHLDVLRQRQCLIGLLDQ